MILAIGGHRHGLTLPPPHRGHVLQVMRPLDIGSYLVEQPPTPITDGIETYHLNEFGMRWTGQQGRQAELFKVYVESTMPKAEAEAWVRLAVTWYVLWATLTIGGLLDYILGMERMQAEVEALSKWAELLDLRRRLDDELS
jgi:hypothetical protein